MGLATMHELGTVYSIENCYDMLEIATVRAHNQRVMRKREEKPR